MVVAGLDMVHIGRGPGAAGSVAEVSGAAVPVAVEDAGT